MKALSTFAGCGGSSLGYEQAGCEVVAAVEWDPHAALCYRLNHPNTIVFEGDIANVSGAEILNRTKLDVGELDVLDGSPPCQGFSISGNRILEDPRNALFRQHMRLVRELQPRHVVIENVSGIIRGKMRRVASEIVSSLKAEGYRVVAGLMEAQYFGVSQLRPRVFFLGSRVGQPALPRPVSMPIPCSVALRDVVPDEIIVPRNASERLLAHNLRPGENGAEMLARMKFAGARRWFSAQMLDPRMVSPTIMRTSRGTAALLHWERRHVSVREALVLTGFPSGYELPGTFVQRWARIGNSVAPPVARAIAMSLESLRG